MTESSVFGKAPDFIVRQADPFNAGPPLERLVANETTPKDLFFVRSHGNVPSVDQETYRLAVTGEVGRKLSLSLNDLRKDFQVVSIAATLQCAGNRRSDLIAHKPIPGELPWGAEAISNARWTGVRLSDVLLAAGVKSNENFHVEFLGLDDVERQNKRFNFGGSVPLEKAFNQEVLLAYEMNGEPLLPVHGSPLRVVVPGYIGARSVKWLQEIRVRVGPSDNYFQAHAYRLFSPEVNAENVDWDKGLMLGQMQLNSVICVPGGEAKIASGDIELRGYAIAGAANQVARVDLSIDGGQTWRQADLDGEPQAWTWRLWRATLHLDPGEHHLVVRAVDTGANVQPAEVEQIWNFKGYVGNAWHRQTLVVS